jgi:chromosome segregation ATPase
MIENSIIDSAKSIRNEFLKLTKTLSVYEDDVKKLAEYFFKVSNELKNIESEITNKDTIESIKNKIISKLSDLELESERVSKKIEDINNQIEKLKKEEMDLYKVIKKRHPSMSDDQIRSEIQERVL